MDSTDQRARDGGRPAHPNGAAPAGPDEDLLVPCPFPDRASPYAAEATGYARRAAAEAGVGGPAAAKVLHGIALGEAAAMSYPDADADRLGVATLWVAFLVLFDDAWSDHLSLEGDWLPAVLAQHRTVHEVLDGRPAGPGDDPLVRVLGRILADIARLDPAWDSTRLRREIRRYLAGTLWELDLRSRGEVPDLVSYLRMRRVFSTMTVQLELDYFVGRLRLPATVRLHPGVQLADAAVSDYSCIANDLYSLRAERARGLTANVVTVLQHEHGWDTATAAARARRLCEQALATYDGVRSRLPNLGLEPDADLRRYFAHHEAFMSAAARWPARTARYREQAKGGTS